MVNFEVNIWLQGKNTTVYHVLLEIVSKPLTLSLASELASLTVLMCLIVYRGHQLGGVALVD